MTDVFPFTLIANERGGPYAFRKVWLDVRPEGFVWYAYDVTIKSRTEIEFIVYDMYSNLHGGIGKEIGRFPTNVDPAVTEQPIEDRVQRLAIRARQDEIEIEEQARITKIAERIRETVA